MKIWQPSADGCTEVLWLHRTISLDKIVQQPSETMRKQFLLPLSVILLQILLLFREKVPLERPVDIPFYTANDSILIKILEDTLHKAIYKSYSFENRGY